MNCHITIPAPIPGKQGFYVIVTLEDITAEEHVLIDTNTMIDYVIARHEKEADHTLADFYNGTTNIRILERPSIYQLNQLSDHIYYGFEQFKKQLAKNNIHYSGYPREPEPFLFYQQHRFRHQHVVGGQGAGKTNFLCNLILHDLDAVAKDEASVVILDSQYRELTKLLPRNKRFAPGGDLAGKLIYLEYNPRHPLAFNIFANTSATGLCDFVLRGLIGAEITTKQSLPYQYLLAAASLVPKANIYDVQDMLKPGGFKIFSDHLTKLTNPRDQEWYRQNWNADIFRETKEQLLYRLSLFTTPLNPLANLLASREDKFKLSDEIQKGRVIVINSALDPPDPNATKTLGRYFIYNVLQAMYARTSATKRLPTYFYIDEAQDYLEQDESVPRLVDLARKQNIGLIIAHQRMAANLSRNVTSALEHMHIQARLNDPGKATITIGRPDNPNQVVKDVAWNEVHIGHPRMSDEEWQSIMTDMHERYCYETGARRAPAADLPPDTHDE